MAGGSGRSQTIQKIPRRPSHSPLRLGLQAGACDLSGPVPLCPCALRSVCLAVGEGRSFGCAPRGRQPRQPSVLLAHERLGNFRASPYEFGSLDEIVRLSDPRFSLSADSDRTRFQVIYEVCRQCVCHLGGCDKLNFHFAFPPPGLSPGNKFKGFRVTSLRTTQFTRAVQ